MINTDELPEFEATLRLKILSQLDPPPCAVPSENDIPRFVIKQAAEFNGEHFWGGEEWIPDHPANRIVSNLLWWYFKENLETYLHEALNLLDREAQAFITELIGTEEAKERAKILHPKDRKFTKKSIDQRLKAAKQKYIKQRYDQLHECCKEVKKDSIIARQEFEESRRHHSTTDDDWLKILIDMGNERLQWPEEALEALAYDAPPAEIATLLLGKELGKSPEYVKNLLKPSHHTKKKRTKNA